MSKPKSEGVVGYPEFVKKQKSPCHGRNFVQHPNPIGGPNPLIWMCPTCWAPFHEFYILLSTNQQFQSAASRQKTDH